MLHPSINATPRTAESLILCGEASDEPSAIQVVATRVSTWFTNVVNKEELARRRDM